MSRTHSQQYQYINAATWFSKKHRCTDTADNVFVTCGPNLQVIWISCEDLDIAPDAGVVKRNRNMSGIAVQ
jgi:hypothetical protein